MSLVRILLFLSSFTADTIILLSGTDLKEFENAFGIINHLINTIGVSYEW